jgi:hypothetical protein
MFCGVRCCWHCARFEILVVVFAEDLNLLGRDTLYYPVQLLFD